MRELKVGERVTLDNFESNVCTGCYFEGSGTCPDGYCVYERSDDKSDIFKEVKE